jgi:hypothetical protein
MITVLIVQAIIGMALYAMRFPKHDTLRVVSYAALYAAGVGEVLAVLLEYLRMGDLWGTPVILFFLFFVFLVYQGDRMVNDIIAATGVSYRRARMLCEVVVVIALFATTLAIQSFNTFASAVVFVCATVAVMVLGTACIAPYLKKFSS